jgi:GntR family transcriptional regulator/MocR family aminotransferase
LYILNPKTPLYQQLYRELKKDIIDNYSVGQKLPSIRKIASLYNLSKNTVESAYSQLYAEGYIDSRAKSGYYVSELYFDSFKELDKTRLKPSTPKNAKPYRYDFFPAQLHKDNFPLKIRITEIEKAVKNFSKIWKKNLFPSLK